MPTATVSTRVPAYLALNLGFLLLVVAMALLGGAPNPRLPHMILLFAVCTTWILNFDRLNGPYALLALFQSFYFVSFGLLDVTNLLNGTSAELENSLYSATEGVILAGAVMLTLGYQLGIRLATSRRGSRVALDWPVPSVLTAGLVIWAVGTVSMFYWGVFVVTDTTIETTRIALNRLSPYAIAGNLLAGMLQPVGILLIAYARLKLRSPLLLTLVIVMVLIQVMLGFVINGKSQAMIAGILVIITAIFVEGRIPKAWVAAGILFAYVGFPILQASRVEVHGERQVARSEILSNLGTNLMLAIEAKARLSKGPDKTQSLLERTSVRGSLQMVVENTGATVPFQHGYTMLPLLYTFIPKLVLADKISIPTGQLVNKEFHVSEYADTYISPSILGELYWNFGWYGVFGGMTIIGLLVGYLGGRFDMSRTPTVTGLLVLVLTTKQVIVAFEGTIAPEYVVWMRLLAAVGILHLLFARVPVADRRAAEDGVDAPEPAAAAPEPTGGGPRLPLAAPGSLGLSSGAPFPNLLR